MKYKRAPLIIFLGLAFIPFCYLFFTGSIFYGEDYLWQFLPFHTLGVELLKSGQLPLWNPYIYSGMPLFANGSFALFYPTIVLLIIFSQNIAINLIYGIHIFIAGYFTYRFCRTLGLARVAGIIAGTAFMFSGNLITLIYPGHTMKLIAASLIPVVFYFFVEALHRKKLSWFLYTAIAISIQIFSTHWQICYYTWLGIGLYGIVYFIRFQVWRTTYRNQFLQLLGLLVLFVIGITAVQWLPFAEYSQWSTRSAGLAYQEATEASYPPEEWLSLVIVSPFGDQVQLGPGCKYLHLSRLLSPAGYLPYYGRFNAPRTLSEYLGVLPFILAIIGLITIRRKYLWFFFGLMLGSLFLSLGKFNPVYPIFYQFFPGLKWLRVPAEILILFTFSLAILAGTGIQGLKDMEGKLINDKRKLWYATLLLLILVILMIVLSFIVSGLAEQKEHLVMTIFRLIFMMLLSALGIFYCSLRHNSKSSIENIIKYLFLILILIVDFGTAHLPYLQAMQLADFYRYVKQDPVINILKQDTDIYRILPLGKEMISNKWIFTQTQSVYGYQSFPLSSYQQYWIQSGFTNETVWQWLNIKYIISPDTLNDDRLMLVADGPRKIYQVKSVYPRAWVTHEPICLEPDTSAIITFDAYTPNRIKLRVQSATPGELIFSELYYPGWKAYLDGKRVQIGITDELFRSLPIPLGEHRVDWVFSPFIFWLGLTISSISIIILGIGFIKDKSETKRYIRNSKS
ncbi:MAG: hypothetical protein ACE14V_13395 [bacterium]